MNRLTSVVSRYIDVLWYSLFFFNDTATPAIYTLSLHDALPISQVLLFQGDSEGAWQTVPGFTAGLTVTRSLPPTVASVSDRKSTRLNSSHVEISYAVFCLKKKKIDS